MTRSQSNLVIAFCLSWSNFICYSSFSSIESRSCWLCVRSSIAWTSSSLFLLTLLTVRAKVRASSWKSESLSAFSFTSFVNMGKALMRYFVASKSPCRSLIFQYSCLISLKNSLLYRTVISQSAVKRKTRAVSFSERGDSSLLKERGPSRNLNKSTLISNFYLSSILPVKSYFSTDTINVSQTC